MSLLQSNECLVYLLNTQPFPDVSGTTHIAKILRTPLQYLPDNNIIQHYELEVITNSNGEYVDEPELVSVTDDKILSNKSYHDIQPRQFYNFDYVASNFVIKFNLNKPLESTSRTALGSGIQGIYISDESKLPIYKTKPEEEVYKILVPNAFIVQDKEHGESITVASLATNRYLDKIINILQGSNITPEELIFFNSIDHLVTLWNIVLYRVDQQLTKEWLQQVLISYCNRYLDDSELIELPINDILIGLGYDGLIGTDSYINGWNRGCYSFDYSKVTKIEGSIAKY